MRTKIVSGIVAVGAFYLVSCDLPGNLGQDDGLGANDDALKRCVITGHAIGGGACASDSAAAAWTKTQCEAQDDAWKDQRQALEDESTMTCEADWD